MTAARQQRKPPLLFRLLLGIALGIGISTPTGLWAATANQLAVNADTDLAINGLDPVAYFHRGQGAICPAGIRIVFGWCSLVVQQMVTGVPFPGTLRSIRHALPATTRSLSAAAVFYIMNRCRAAFLADPGRIIDNAERKWPDILGQ